MSRATDLPATNVRTYFNRPDPGQRSQNNASDITGDGTYTLVGNASCAPTATLLEAVSRKTHGTAGNFDIPLYPLPAGVAPAIEPRRGGTPGNHQLVLVFPAPVTFSGVTASGGTVNTDPAPNSAPASEVMGQLTGVPNAQLITVELNGVTAGAAPTTISVMMNVLLGDTNIDGVVNFWRFAADAFSIGSGRERGYLPQRCESGRHDQQR